MQQKYRVVALKEERDKHSVPRARRTQAPAARRPSRGAAARRKRARRRRLTIGLGMLTAAIVLLAVAKNLLSPQPADAVPAQTEESIFYGPPYVVAVDAGHGGDDLGAQGFVTEVELTEATTDALLQLLGQDPNFTPVRVRENGEGLSLADRAQRAGKAGAQLFLSIHGNSDETQTAAGFECFAQPPGRTWHEQSLRFAQEIAAGMRDAGAVLRGENGVRYTYYVDDGAGGYYKEIAEESDETVRTEQTFGVLERAGCPGVLVEQCFITDAADVQMWGSPEGYIRAARVYYEAICRYFGTQAMA